MPTYQFTIEQFSRDGDTVHLIVSSPDWKIERRVTFSKVDTKEKLAQWIIEQSKPVLPVRDNLFEGIFTVDTTVSIVKDHHDNDQRIEEVVSVIKV